MAMIIKASLIFCASFSAIILLEIPQVDCQVLKLDMAPNAVTDQYLGCEDQMYEKVRSTDLLHYELSRNPAFSARWSQAKVAWPKKKKAISLPKGFRDEYGIAIVAYTGNLTYKEFNNAVSEGFNSSEHYMTNFHFKSLHFYLTMGLRLLKKSCKAGETVYRGSTDEFEPESQTIRFGKFTSTSLDRKEAEKFGNTSFFTVTTCLGVEIEPFSLFPKESEVLIPVNEEFNVTEYDPQGHQFFLNGTETTCSEENCVYLNGGFGSSSRTSRIARSAEKSERIGSPPPYCLYNSAPGSAGVMTSLLFSVFLVVRSTAVL